MTPELNHLLVLKRTREEPKTVVHCGSTRKAMKQFEEYRLKDTLEGMIVLTIGASKNDEILGISIVDAIELDILHLFKIERADLVRPRLTHFAHDKDLVGTDVGNGDVEPRGGVGSAAHAGVNSAETRIENVLELCEREIRDLQLPDLRDDDEAFAPAEIFSGANGHFRSRHQPLPAIHRH